MPVLILLGILAAYGVHSAVDAATPPTNHSKNVIEKMSDEMVGKSRKECRKILRKYR